MLCQSCGKWVPDDSSFCNYCGSRLRTSEPAAPQQSLSGQASPQPVEPPVSPTPQPAERPVSLSRQLMLPSSQSPSQPGGLWGYGKLQAGGAPVISAQRADSNSIMTPEVTLGPATDALQQDYRQKQAASPTFVTPPAFSPSPMPHTALPALAQPPVQGRLRAATVAAPEPQRVQRLRLQLSLSSLKNSPWLGIVVGGVGAALLGAACFIVLYAVLDGAQSSIQDPNLPMTLLLAPANVISVHNVLRDGLQEMLMALGVSRHITGSYTTAAGNLALSMDISSPLTISLLMLALPLLAGGYLAAYSASSYRVRVKLLLGAAISLPYMLLLLLLSTQVYGNIAIPLFSLLTRARFSTLHHQVSMTLGVNRISLILLSLLWGSLFGMIGASFKCFRGNWRGQLWHFLRSNASYRITSVMAGGVLAGMLGFLLVLLFVYVMLANIQVSQSAFPYMTRAMCTRLEVTELKVGPMLAVQLLAFSFATPISLTLQVPGLHPNAMLLTTLGYRGQTSFSLLGSLAHPSPWLSLLLLIPIISLCAGGRLSAALGRSTSISTAALQGALIAVPFTLIMLLLMALSTISLGATISGVGMLNVPGVQLSLSLGANMIYVMLSSLVLGACLGALGGMYHASAVSREVDAVLAQCERGLQAFLAPLYGPGRGKAPPMMRSRTLDLLWSALLITALLTVCSIAVGIVLLSLSTVILYDLTYKVHALMNSLLIALPGLLLLSALISVLFDEPQSTSQVQEDDKKASLESISGGSV